MCLACAVLQTVGPGNEGSALLGLTLTLCNSNLVILMQKYVLGVCVVADG